MIKLIRLFKAEQGATAIEYAIMAGLIAAVIIGAVILIGQSTQDSFSNLAANMPSGS